MRTDNKDASVEPCCEQPTTPEGKLQPCTCKVKPGHRVLSHGNSCPQAVTNPTWMPPTAEREREAIMAERERIMVIVRAIAAPGVARRIEEAIHE